MSIKKPLDLAKPFRALIGIGLLIVILVTNAQVILRYIFNHPLNWSDELVRFIVVWMCMISAAVLSFDDTHMAIYCFVEHWPRKLQFFVYTFRQILVFVFCVVCAYSSYQMLGVAAQFKSGVLPLTYMHWRVSATIGLSLTAVYTVGRYFYDLGRFRKDEFYLGDGNQQREDM